MCQVAPWDLNATIVYVIFSYTGYSEVASHSSSCISWFTHTCMQPVRPAKEVSIPERCIPQIFYRFTQFLHPYYRAFTLKISLVILLIVRHTIFVLWVWRIWYEIEKKFPIDVFLYTHHLSAWNCIVSIRRNSLLVNH